MHPPTPDDTAATKHNDALRIVHLLRSILALDPVAINALISTRFACNSALADHPTVQVGSLGENGPYVFGILGVLNGLVGVDSTGHGCIIAIVDEQTGEVTNFTVLEDRL